MTRAATRRALRCPGKVVNQGEGSFYNAPVRVSAVFPIVDRRNSREISLSGMSANDNVVVNSSSTIINGPDRRPSSLPCAGTMAVRRFPVAVYSLSLQRVERLSRSSRFPSDVTTRSAKRLAEGGGLVASSPSQRFVVQPEAVFERDTMAIRPCAVLGQRNVNEDRISSPCRLVYIVYSIH